MINRDLIIARITTIKTQAVALTYSTVSLVRKHTGPFEETCKSLSEKFIAARDAYELKSAPRLSTKEQMFFAKRLSFLIKAGVPILESLQMISGQTTSRGSARHQHCVQ